MRFMVAELCFFQPTLEQLLLCPLLKLGHQLAVSRPKVCGAANLARTLQESIGSLKPALDTWMAHEEPGNYSFPPLHVTGLSDRAEM